MVDWKTCFASIARKGISSCSRLLGRVQVVNAAEQYKKEFSANGREYTIR